MTTLPMAPRGVCCRYRPGSNPPVTEFAPARLFTAPVRRTLDPEVLWLTDPADGLHFGAGMAAWLLRTGELPVAPTIVAIDREAGLLQISGRLDLEDGDALATYVEDGPWSEEPPEGFTLPVQEPT